MAWQSSKTLSLISVSVESADLSILLIDIFITNRLGKLDAAIKITQQQFDSKGW